MVNGGARRRLLCWLAAIAFLVGCTTEGQPGAAPPELPSQALLTSSMRNQPVPGWTASVADLELPARSVLKPIGAIGNRVVVVAISREGRWLLGFDVDDGERTFGPVPLDTASDAASFDCYVNGPPRVLCVGQAEDPGVPATAWVVDTATGTVIHQGKTEVKIVGAQVRPHLEQVGDRVVATLEGKGVYGVGSQGELTWFVPGDGILSAQFAFWDHDTPSSVLAVQGGPAAEVVFSTADGNVVTPSLPQDARARRAVVYPEGLGVEYSVGPGQDFAMFFDNSGHPRSGPIEAGQLENRSLDIPIVTTKSMYRAFTLDGRQLLEIPRTDSSPNARLIGSQFFIADDQLNRQWQHFDLSTGHVGKTCENRNLGIDYIGSDGEVAVTRGEGILVQGVDLATCETLWSIAGARSDEVTEIWKVGSTLIQRTDDRIFSLVAPH